MNYKHSYSINSKTKGKNKNTNFKFKKMYRNYRKIVWFKNQYLQIYRVWILGIWTHLAAMVWTNLSKVASLCTGCLTYTAGLRARSRRTLKQIQWMFADLRFLINQLWSSHVAVVSSDVPKKSAGDVGKTALEQRPSMCCWLKPFFPYQHTKHHGWYIFFFKKIIQH